MPRNKGVGRHTTKKRDAIPFGCALHLQQKMGAQDADGHKAFGVVAFFRVRFFHVFICSDRLLVPASPMKIGAEQNMGAIGAPYTGHGIKKKRKRPNIYLPQVIL
nr:hypothetical protein [Pandoravirus massiliensis]